MSKKFDESLVRRAYVEGLKLKNSGLDEEVIYAKIEKQGIPAELAREVAHNVILERNKKEDRELADKGDIGLIMLIVGIVASLIAYYLTEKIMISTGLIMGGAVIYFVANKKRKDLK